MGVATDHRAIGQVAGACLGAWSYRLVKCDQRAPTSSIGCC